jgi:hypothetical protein
MAGSSKKAIYAALVGNSLIAVTKFAAASYTGSAAMMSDTPLGMARKSISGVSLSPC